MNVCVFEVVVGYFIHGTSRPAFEANLKTEEIESLFKLVSNTKPFESEVDRELLYGFDIDTGTREYRRITVDDSSDFGELSARLHDYFVSWKKVAKT